MCEALGPSSSQLRPFSGEVRRQKANGRSGEVLTNPAKAKWGASLTSLGTLWDMLAQRIFYLLSSLQLPIISERRRHKASTMG